MDSTSSNPGGHSDQPTTTQQSEQQQPPAPSSDLTSIPGLGAIPGLGSAAPSAPPAKTTDTPHPAPPAATDEVTTTAPRNEEPSVTNALEAMLGGLSPEDSTSAMATDTPAQAVPVTEAAEAEDTKMEDSHPPAAAEDTSASPASAPTTVTADAPPTDAAMIDYIIPPTSDGPADEQEGGAPEFEADSSPYESSSDDSSDSSDSSDEDSDEEDGYNLLSPAEQARILMLGDVGSDDEGGGGKGGKSSGNQLRTKNEVPDEVIPKPDVVLAADTPVTELGSVTSIVDTMVLIAATTSGEFRVLESGSLLCLEDRSVIGVVAETLGRVQEPLYVVRFTTPADITAAGLEKGIKVYYPSTHATFVFTAALKAYKGSDASNLHDEEVGDEEMEFSDDEKEMEHKRRVKAKKLEKRGIAPSSRGGRGGGARGGAGGEHPLRKEGLSYDDEEEGPYRPLARPSGFSGRGDATEEAPRGYGAPGPGSSTGERGGRGRGGERGRGDRGRGRGGGGQGAHAPRYPPAPADAPQDPRKMGMGMGGFGFAPPGQGQQFPQQQQFPFQQFGQQTPPLPFPGQQQGQQQFPYAPYGMPSPQQQWGAAAAAGVQGGAFLNPAFFGQQQQGQQAPAQQQGQGQQGQQQQWTPPNPAQFGGWTPPAPPPSMPQMGGTQQQSPEAARAVAEMQERLRVLREGGQGGQGQGGQ